MTRSVSWWIFLIFGTYLCSVLSILPLNEAYQWARPQWLLMFVIFCQATYPKAFNPIFAWLIGLLLDGLLGTRLGEHALIFAVISYVTAFIGHRFPQQTMIVQMIKVLLLVCMGQILNLWFHAFEGYNPHTLFYWLGTISSCVLWPMFVILLRFLSQLMKVASSPSRSI